jgi:hypothetical protein
LNQLQNNSLNRLLLDYFVHSELSKKKEVEKNSCSPLSDSSNENIPTSAHSRKGSDKEFKEPIQNTKLLYSSGPKVDDSKEPI